MLRAAGIVAVLVSNPFRMELSMELSEALSLDCCELFPRRILPAERCENPECHIECERAPSSAQLVCCVDGVDADRVFLAPAVKVSIPRELPPGDVGELDGDPDVVGEDLPVGYAGGELEQRGHDFKDLEDVRPFPEWQDAIEGHVVHELPGLEQNPSFRVLHAWVHEIDLGRDRLENRAPAAC